MEILEAYDLTGSFRQAAASVGCDHKTVAYWVRMREEAGGMPMVERKRRAMEAEFAAKVDELVDRSRGKIRADVAHGKLLALGYEGSPRTTRRWAAGSQRRWRQRNGRRTRSWIPEPGLWMQWDYADGPTVGDRATVLFCARLAWSRFRALVPLRDKTLPSVVMGLDRALRRFGGVPTYALTDNEKTVSVDHVCGIAVRSPVIVEVAGRYGLTVATSVPADPSVGGRSTRCALQLLQVRQPVADGPERHHPARLIAEQHRPRLPEPRAPQPDTSEAALQPVQHRHSPRPWARPARALAQPHVQLPERLKCTSRIFRAAASWAPSPA